MIEFEHYSVDSEIVTYDNDDDEDLSSSDEEFEKLGGYNNE